MLHGHSHSPCLTLLIPEAAESLAASAGDSLVRHCQRMTISESFERTAHGPA